MRPVEPTIRQAQAIAAQTNALTASVSASRPGLQRFTRATRLRLLVPAAQRAPMRRGTQSGRAHFMDPSCGQLS